MIVAASAAPAAASAAVGSAFSFSLSSISAFAMGWLLSWPALIAILAFGIMAEHGRSHGWAITWGIVALVVTYFMFSVSVMTLVYGAIVYLLVGAVWSVIRYNRHVSLMIETHKHSDAPTKAIVLQRLHPTNMISTFLSWMLIWPFSAVEHLVGDVIDLLSTALSTFFGGIYKRIYQRALDGLK